MLMLDCDLCHIWYHAKCLKISEIPKIFICMLCKTKKSILESYNNIISNINGNKD